MIRIVDCLRRKKMHKRARIALRWRYALRASMPPAGPPQSDLSREYPDSTEIWCADLLLKIALGQSEEFFSKAPSSAHKPLVALAARMHSRLRQAKCEAQQILRCRLLLLFDLTVIHL